MPKRRIITEETTVFNKKIVLSGYADDGYFHEIFRENDTYDEDLLILLQTITKIMPGRSILDVGANIGYVTCVLAKHNPAKVIHSFEPVPSNSALLKSNTTLNKLKNVVVHPYGLASAAQKGSASWDPDNRASAFITKEGQHERYPEHEKVELKVLDKETRNLKINDCGLIKVDIEGYELEFLRGAKEFINEFKPVVVTEINHWCLDALQRITLPEFIDELLDIFPYVHGFWGNRLIDVREHTEAYMHENIVDNRYMNVICSFDANYHNEILAKYQKAASHLDYEKGLPVNVISDLKKDLNNAENYGNELVKRIADQEQQIAFLQRQQRDVRFLASRLAEELQVRLNKRAKSTKNEKGLVYGFDETLDNKLAGKSGKADLLAFIRRRDQANIRPAAVKPSAKAKPLFWKATAYTFRLATRGAKKIAGRGHGPR